MADEVMWRKPTLDPERVAAWSGVCLNDVTNFHELPSEITVALRDAQAVRGGTVSKPVRLSFLDIVRVDELWFALSRFSDILMHLAVEDRYCADMMSSKHLGALEAAVGIEWFSWLANLALQGEYQNESGPNHIKSKWAEKNKLPIHVWVSDLAATGLRFDDVANYIGAGVRDVEQIQYLVENDIDIDVYLALSSNMSN
jgi:hypothetical protein